MKIRVTIDNRMKGDGQCNRPHFGFRPSDFGFRVSTRAFTLIEIAISLGVIAVALIAIMGVLPGGMQVQRDNRQDTIINSDGAYLLEAIRNSAMGVPDLTNFAEVVDNLPAAGMTNGEIILRMSEPGRPHTNVFRSITGPVAMRGEGMPTFRYRVISDIHPVDLDMVNTNLYYAATMASNLFEVRLVFLWPLLANSSAVADVAQKQVMRTLMAGTWDTNLVFHPTEFQ